MICLYLFILVGDLMIYLQCLLISYWRYLYDVFLMFVDFCWSFDDLFLLFVYLLAL